MSFEEKSNEGGIDTIKREAEIQWIFGEPVNNSVRRQIQLAVEMYLESNPWDKGYLNREKVDSIVLNWATEEGNRNSKSFREFCNHLEFKTHPRIGGNYANITVADFEYFRDTGELPEN